MHLPDQLSTTATSTVWSGKRRGFLRALGVAGATAVGGTGLVAAAQGTTIDDDLTTDEDVLQEVLVVFDGNDDVERLRHLDLERGYHRFEVLPIGYTVLTGAQIETVADWPEVRFVQKNAELDYHNNDARATTEANAVQNDLGYTGSSVHAAVIDTGVDGDHPDLGDDLVHNFRYVNPLSSTEDTTWVDAGDIDTDDNGHGTHTTGSLTASGQQSEGEFRGMAPDADLTVYSAGLTLLVVKPVAAYDHLLARHRDGETDVRLVSNSWGTDSGRDFNPDDAVNVATWHAYRAGILSLFSAGNSGEACETEAGLDCWTDYNTLNDYAKAPHVLGVAATNDAREVTDFSSRGRRPGHEWGDNYARKKALDNLEEYHAAPKTDTPVDSGSFSGTVGPGAQDAGVGESSFHEWTAPSKAGYIEATLSWSPSEEDIDFYLREGAPDGEVVASGASLSEPEELSGLVEGGTTYYFEVRPYVNVASDYDISFTAYEGATRDVTPMGIYRLGVGAPGELVMSTLEPTDALQAYYEDTEVWYGRISGTSMSCPVTAGAATLVYDAALQNAHDPSPIEVLNTIEATAKDYHDGYTPWNIGAGFVDAMDAVRRAEDGRWASFGEVKLVEE